MTNLKLKKWRLFDGTENGVEFRFDELINAVKNGEIHSYDLIKSPKDEHYIPVVYSKALSYAVMKRKQFEIMHPEKRTSFLLENKRFLEKEEKEFEDDELIKFKIYKKIKNRIKLLMEKNEVIIYFVFSVIYEGIRNSKIKNKMFVLLTNKRIFRFLLDNDNKFITDIKYFYYNMISSFDYKKDMLGRQSLEIVVDNMLFVIKGLTDCELKIFSTVLDSFLFVSKEMLTNEEEEINLNSLDKELFESLYEEKEEEGQHEDNIFLSSFHKKEKYSFFEIIRLTIEFFIMVGLFLNAYKIAFDYYFFILGIFSVIVLAEAVILKRIYLKKSKIAKKMKALP